MSFGNSANNAHRDIVAKVNEYAANRPRALQVELGASSIGTSCQRQLAYRLLGVKSSRGDRDPGWLSQIGTAVHSYLETIFATDDRYLTEQPVTIRYNGLEIPGTVDLYDKQEATVIDFKIVGEDTLSKARRGQVSTQYQVQVNLYGLGLQQAGHVVKNVAICFLPRNKELSESIFHQMPLDTQLVDAYLQRYAATRQLVTGLGVDALEATMTANAPCIWCDYYNPNAKTTATGCTGAILQRRDTAK